MSALTPPPHTIKEQEDANYDEQGGNHPFQGARPALALSIPLHIQIRPGVIDGQAVQTCTK